MSKMYARAYYYRNKEKFKEYRLRNKDRIRSCRQDYYQKNKDRLKEYSRVYHEKNKEKRKEHKRSYRLKNKELIRKRNQELRLELLEAVGGLVCKKCGFDDWRALQVDHVSGNGAEERKTQSQNYLAMIKQVREVPKKYQVLCANCNWIKKYENNENGKRGGSKHE